MNGSSVDRYLVLNTGARIGHETRSNRYGTSSAARDVGTLTGELVEYLQTRSARQERWRADIEAGADVYRYEGDIPCNLLVIDETVFIKSSRSDSVKLSYAEPIVSENEIVRAWANDLIDTYRTEAAPIVDPFAAGS